MKSAKNIYVYISVNDDFLVGCGKVTLLWDRKGITGAKIIEEWLFQARTTT